jgi:hypothetical protein
MKMQAILVLVSIWGGLGVMASDFDLSGQLGNAGYIRAASSTNLQVSFEEFLVYGLCQEMWAKGGTVVCNV